MSMSKFEYKLTFESDAEYIPDILEKITKTIRKELLDEIKRNDQMGLAKLD